MRRRAMGRGLTMKKKNAEGRVHYERKSAWVRVDHEKRAMG